MFQTPDIIKPIAFRPIQSQPGVDDSANHFRLSNVSTQSSSHPVESRNENGSLISYGIYGQRQRDQKWQNAVNSSYMQARNANSDNDYTMSSYKRQYKQDHVEECNYNETRWVELLF